MKLDWENFPVKQFLRIKESSTKELRLIILKIYSNITNLIKEPTANNSNIDFIQRWFIKENWEEIQVRDYFDKTHSEMLNKVSNIKNKLWIIKFSFVNWKTILISTENSDYYKNFSNVFFLDEIIKNLDKASQNKIINLINELKINENLFFRKKKAEENNSSEVIDDIINILL